MSPRTAGLLGFAAMGTWLVLYAIAAVSYPGYDMSRNYLSDLGHPSAPAAWAFNAACFLAGLLFLPFGLNVGLLLGGRLAVIGGGAFSFAAFFLALVGVYPEASPNNLHFIVSATFFILLALAAAILTVPLYRSPRFGAIPGILAALTVVNAVVLIAAGLHPLPEHTTVFTAIAWSGVVSLSLVMEKPAA